MVVMQLENFEIDGNGISLNWQGHNLDLHNCFTFQSISYDVALRQVKLIWRRSPEEWAKHTVLPDLTLVFKSVSFFRVKERDTDYPFTEDDCLLSLSFHSTEERDEFDSISLSHSPTDDLTFFFQSEWGLKSMQRRQHYFPQCHSGNVSFLNRAKTTQYACAQVHRKPATLP